MRKLHDTELALNKAQDDCITTTFAGEVIPDRLIYHSIKDEE